MPRIDSSIEDDKNVGVFLGIENSASKTKIANHDKCLAFAYECNGSTFIVGGYGLETTLIDVITHGERTLYRVKVDARDRAFNAPTLHSMVCPCAAWLDSC